MIEYKKRILVKEFSFLPKVLEMSNLTIEIIDEVKIKKCDENLLARTAKFEEEELPYENSYSRAQGEKYFAIYDDSIFEIPHCGMYATHFNMGGTKYYKADSVAEELLKANIEPDFIVVIIYDEYEQYGQTESNLHNLIIYKAKNFNIVEYHANQFRLAAQELSAEILACNR